MDHQPTDFDRLFGRHFDATKDGHARLHFDAECVGAGARKPLAAARARMYAPIAHRARYAELLDPPPVER